MRHAIIYLYEVFCYQSNEYGLYTNLKDARIAVEEKCKRNDWISDEGYYNKTEEISIIRRVMGWGKEEIELVKYVRILEGDIIKTTREILK